MFGFMNRRHFFQHSAGYSLMTLPCMSFLSRLFAAQDDLKKSGKHIIIGWHSGGWDHLDLWDQKVGAPTQFEGQKPGKTAVEGIEIHENLKKIGENMKDFVIVRSLMTSEGDHNRGTTLMNTGRSPNPVVTHPSLAALVTQQQEKYVKSLDIPAFVNVGGNNNGSGFLGMNYAPFTVQNPGTAPENIKAPQSLGNGKELEERIRRRQRLFWGVEDNFISSMYPNAKGDDRRKYADASLAHGDISEKAFNIVASGRGKVFEFSPKDKESDFGTSQYAKGMLLATKLVEAGSTAVQVSMGGHDIHQGAQAAIANLANTIDSGVGPLITRLKSMGLYKDTVVILLSEFGRTPRINANAGRDHWARCWSVALGGGLIKGGQVYGETTKDGMDIKDGKCSIGDIFATVFAALGLDPKNQVRDNLGRPGPIADSKDGPLKGLI